MKRKSTIERVAQCWCTPETEKCVMQPEVAEKFSGLLDSLLDEAGARISALESIIIRCEEDINWMLNNGRFLNPSVFKYLHEAADAVRADKEG